jgi:hypothetical protein
MQTGESPSATVYAPEPNDQELRALSFGARIPARADARVHSIFERAANLELAGRRLVVLLDAKCPNAPHGIRVAAAAWLRLRPCLHVGDTVQLEPDRLSFARGDGHIDLSEATRWQVALAHTNIDWFDARVVAAFAAACAITQAAKACAADSAAAFYSRRLAQVMPSLRSAIACLRVGAAGTQLQRLLGLGPGLTPSGDDFIVGCLAGLAMSTRDVPERKQFLAELARRLESELGATTPISRQHLNDACHFEFAQPLAELAMAIAAGAPDVLSRANAALNVGAYSGADGVTGLLFGLQAWRAQATPMAAY